MKTTVAAIMVLILIEAGFAQADPLPDYPFVFAAGAAQEKIAPNICTISYQIRVRDIDAAKATRAIEARSAEMLAVLLKHGVLKENVVAFEVNKDVIRDYGKEDRKLGFLGYEIDRKTEFTITDLKTYGPIVTALLKAPDVLDIEADFNRTDHKEIAARLIAQAVADAKANAQIMAEGSGQRLVRLRAISQHGLQNISEYFGLGNRDVDLRMYSMDVPGERDMLFIPTTIEFRSGVSTIYEIEEKK